MSGPMTGVTAAVIPAAGLGTRFLPATKAMPKEMLPIVDKPAIQFVVEEAVAAGLNDLLFITSRGKRALEDHFDQNIELEAALTAKNDDARLAVAQESNDLAHIHYVRQGQALGLGHAVLMAEHHVGDQPFAVLLGDDLIDERDPIMPRMIEVRERLGGSVLCLMRVPHEDISLYGCVAVSDTDSDDVVEVTETHRRTRGVGPSPRERGWGRARSRLRWSSIRHRRQAQLPQGGHPVRNGAG